MLIDVIRMMTILGLVKRQSLGVRGLLAGQGIFKVFHGFVWYFILCYNYGIDSEHTYKSLFIAQDDRRRENSFVASTLGKLWETLDENRSSPTL